MGAVTHNEDRMLPAAKAGHAFTVELASPETWSVAMGQLPPGLSLEPDGRLHGDSVGPAGHYNVDVVATAENGNRRFVTLALIVDE